MLASADFPLSVQPEINRAPHRSLPMRENPGGWQKLSTHLIAFIYHDEMTAPIVPNPDERMFATEMPG